MKYQIVVNSDSSYFSSARLDSLCDEKSDESSSASS